jgi:hypothetical protein
MSRTSAITLILMLAIAVAAASTSTSTAAPTYNCWTCPNGYKHWYDLGWSAPSNGDKCQCVQSTTTTTTTKSPTTTTKASTTTTTTKAPTTTTTKASTTTTAKVTTTTATPTTTRNCWTCPNGYKHWYDLGMNQPADPCACVAVTTTVVPVATTTTKAPTTTTTTASTTTKASTTTTTKAPTTTTTKASTTTTSKVTTTTSTPTSTRMQTFITAMTPTSTSLGSISFSAGVGSYSPSNSPPLTLVSSLMDNLIASTNYRTIMTYYIDAYTIPLAAAKGLKVLGIIYIVPGQDNSDLINTAISVAKSYPDTLIAISCGNSMGGNYGLTDAVVSAVSQCTTMLRSAGVVQPIGVIDTFYSWCSNDEYNCNVAWTAVSQYADWIGKSQII